MTHYTAPAAIISTLLAIGVCQSSLFAIFMYRRSQSLLGLWLTLFSIEVGSKILLYANIAIPISQWFGFWFNFDLLYGPLLYLWIRNVVGKPISRGIVAAHLAPFFLFYAIYIPDVFVFSRLDFNAVLTNYLTHDQWLEFSPLIRTLQSITLWHPTAYTLLSLALVLKHRVQLAATNQYWLVVMVTLQIIMWVGVIGWLTWSPLPVALSFMASYLPTVVWINAIAYLNLSRLQITLSHPPHPVHNTDKEGQSEQPMPTQFTRNEIQPSKYRNTRLPKQEVTAIATQLDTTMKAGLYAQPRLNLNTLADSVALPSHHVSQVINEHFGCHFTDYVNHYRIEAIKLDLIEPKLQQTSILDIAIHHGFSSKSTFNNAFKKVTGITPSQYRKKQREEKV
ncbi:helix-turn-helix domain-containing protein [Thaumasiovibrio subtropicus]|uniref:helix-turn-helix domain-containing protein n=1 Tax=Thaumasiovibrio subtropicus TaxID=1891207 RepID=UPI000B34EF89|nr:AraC family transcriptional regulator [Thaumasiovibrio subtropicus]